MKERRYDIDWLRVMAILMVFFFHNARFYDPYPWHVKNAGQSFGMFLFVALLHSWIMPFFFLLSGVGSWYALKSRTAGRYLHERVLRLLVPLYTVGVFILLPPQLYWDRVTNGRFSGSFMEFYPSFFKNFNFDLLPPFIFPWFGHLWFLAFLFAISLFSLPLMVFLKSESGKRFISTLAGLCNRCGGIFLLLIPLFLVQGCLRGFFRGDHTFADLVYYLLCFWLGYILPADERFTESFKKHAWVCFPLALVGFCIEGYLVIGLGYQPLPGNGFSPLGLYLLFQFVMSVQTLCWIVFLVGMSAKYLSFRSKLLEYCNEAVLPFYILHQTFILLVGWYVVQWNTSIFIKFLVISIISFTLIALTYELLIRRFNWIRFIFGMRLKRKKYVTT
ncbi:MAG: acyltransferase family protein [Planctomycetota bacterium]|jgi:peptidoglycan/LPS O-acetylase OafA/YrhL